MGETANHQQPPPPPQVVSRPPGPALPLGAARGPVLPPAEQLQQLHYCIHSNPSWPITFLLAFQHYIVMLGTIVLIASTLVPRMGGDHGDKARVIQTLLFMAGLNTLLQTFLGTRLPTVMSASFAFTLPVLSIIKDYSDRTFSDEHELLVGRGEGGNQPPPTPTPNQSFLSIAFLIGFGAVFLFCKIKMKNNAADYDFDACRGFLLL